MTIRKCMQSRLQTQTRSLAECDSSQVGASAFPSAVGGQSPRQTEVKNMCSGVQANLNWNWSSALLAVQALGKFFSLSQFHRVQQGDSMPLAVGHE